MSAIISTAQRRILGRLHHQHVAGAERGRDLERAQHDRRIPRDDGADDAERLAARAGQHVLAERHGLALQLRRKPAEIAEDVGRQLGLAARLGAQRIAGLERNGARQLLDARLYGFGDLEQKLAALARHDRSSRPERPCRRPATAASTSAAAARGTSATSVRLPGFSDRDALPRSTADPLAADQHALGLVRAGGLGHGLGLGRSCRHGESSELRKRPRVWPARREATRPTASGI